MNTNNVIFGVLVVACVLLASNQYLKLNDVNTDSDVTYQALALGNDDDMFAELLSEIDGLKQAMNDMTEKIDKKHSTVGNLTLEAVLANFSKQQQASAAAADAPVKEATVAPKFVERSKQPRASLNQVLASYEKGECSEVDKIYFLKTSKTGSTSVANILTRFGLRRPGTNFLMGEVSNGGFFFKNGFMPFTAETCYMGRNLPDQPKFDISYVHMRYNKTAVNEVMHPDHKKITILREPTANFVSSWRYYSNFYEEMRKTLPLYLKRAFLTKSKEADFIAEMEDFLIQPTKYLETLAFSHGAHFFLYNPQMVFFGYPSYLIKYTTEPRVRMLVDAWLNEIDVDFDHVLILEELDTSLAVLMIKFCWSIDDVVHLKLNSMRKEERTLSDDSLRRLKTMNWADYKLYDRMLKRLNREVREIGEEKVAHYVTLINERIDVYVADCVEPPPPSSAALPLAWISSIKLRADHRRNQTCHMLTKDLSNYIIFEKVIRWKNDFPDFFKNVQQGSMATKVAPMRKVFQQCMSSKSFTEWFEKQEPYVRSFFQWPTNEYSIRQHWPSHIKQFAMPLTPSERSWGTKYRKIFN